MNSKYDLQLANELLIWIQEVTGEELSSVDGSQVVEMTGLNNP